MSSPRIVPSTNDVISGARTASVSRAASSNAMSAWTSTGRAFAIRYHLLGVAVRGDDHALADPAGTDLDLGVQHTN